MKKMHFNEVRVPFTPYLMDITRFHQSNFFKIQLYHQNYSFLILNRKMLSHKMIQEFDKISSLFYGFSKRKYFTFRSNLGIKFNRYEEN